MKNKESYRGWTIITEKSSVQVGRSCQVFWECRAYKEFTEAEAEMITPARSLDRVAAYREACARIDRLIGAQGTQDRQNLPGRQGTTIQSDAQSNTSALAAEFSDKPKLLNLTYRVENERANHRQEPHRRPKSRIRSHRVEMRRRLC